MKKYLRFSISWTVLVFALYLVAALGLIIRGDLASRRALFKAEISLEKKSPLSVPAQKLTSSDQEIEPQNPPERPDPSIQIDHSRGLCYTSITPIRFYQNQVTLEATQKTTLDKLCQCLSENRAVSLFLQGSSSSKESPPQAMAARRARAVKKYLVDGSCGLDTERLSEQGSAKVGPASGGTVEFKVRK